jgi:predicted nucleic acid-binding protein
MPAVVADSSPLVYLARLGRLELLRLLYSEVLIPDAVWREVAVEGAALAEGRMLMAAASAGWIRVAGCAPAAVGDEPLLQGLDAGEREAITLAIRLRALLIIDEAEGRAAATKLGVKLTGTLGVLVQATRRGFVPRLQTELDRLMVETNFRCADELIVDALKVVGER